MITLFIPVYNGERHLRQTLGSVLAQTCGEWELLAVDDSSTDGSLALLEEYAAGDSRIRLFRKPNGGDVPHAWQFAMPLVRGEWVLYMSQDDLLAPDTLRLLIDRQRATGADAVMPTVVQYREGQPVDTLPQLRGVGGDTRRLLSGTEAFALMMDYTITGFALWRTSLIRQHPVPLLTFNSDEYAQREWASRCRTVAFSEALFLYRQDNPQAITKRFSHRHLEASLTEALVLQRALALGIDTARCTAYATRVYSDLWFRTMLYMSMRRQLTPERRRQLRRLFNRAWRLTHAHLATPNRRLRLSSRNLALFWLLVTAKHWRATLLDHNRHDR